MISPFAPLYPWLREALDDAQLVLAIESPDPDDPRPALEAYDVGDHLLDLRHGPTRYAVLRALADAGHSRPWALGEPWSSLTDEQAGRACAEIVRAVGEDPSKPVGVVPVAVLGEWGENSWRHSYRWTRRGVAGSWGTADAVLGVSTIGWSMNWVPQGHQIDAAGRLAADTAARTRGCIMIEEITP